MIIIDGIIFSLQRYGGISMYFNNIIKQMRDSKLNDLKVIGYGGSNANSLCDEILEYRILERYRDFKSMHISSEAFIMHSSYYRVSKDKNIRNVISVYDFLYEKFEKNPIKLAIHKAQKNHAIANAHSVICISESTKNDFLYYYPKFNRDNVFVTHLSHSHDFKISSEFNINDKFKRPYVVFVGMRSFHKNFEICVKALESFVDLELIIVGGGKLNNNEKMLLDKFISNRYTHKLNLTSQELCKLYQSAICLLYPSIYEGFGIPILEAMASGCPVISTNASSIPEVANKSAILLDIPCRDSISEAINRLLIESNNLNYIQLGLDNATRFNWEETALKTVEIYKNILK